jgi:uncharacterized membrane protein YedE/YeeE
MFAALVGGLLIGSAAGLLFLVRGRIAGIGGVFGGLVTGAGWREDLLHKALFVFGLVAAGVICRVVRPSSFEPIDVSYGVVVLGGLLVGFGMQRGAGCTSGHGVCGIARLSKRSIVATITFMGTAALTVLATHHLLGGAR